MPHKNSIVSLAALRINKIQQIFVTIVTIEMYIILDLISSCYNDYKFLITYDSFSC